MGRKPRVRRGARESGPQTPSFGDQLEGRNVVHAALEASTRVREIWIDRQARPTPGLKRLEALARERGVRWVPCPRKDLDAICRTGVHNGVIAFADSLPQRSLKEVLDEAEAAGVEPVVVVLDEVQYEQNLGAILRTAAAVGATCIVTPTRRGASATSVVQRVAMGGAEQVPVVREGLNSALAQLRRRGLFLIGAEADGPRPYWEADFSGPLAIVLGGEDRGLGPKIRERCDVVVSIPLTPGVVRSLNVSVAAGLLLFERARTVAR